MPAPTLLYLHGFRSSPASAKARITARRIEEINRAREAAGATPVRWICPQLPPSPAAAIALCRERVAGVAPEALHIIGSSLGGFYATHLAETLGCRAALLNPAVDPARDLAGHIGTQTAWHDPALEFRFTAEHVQELRALEIGDLRRPVPHPERFFAVIAKGDEVLDWREMAARYAGARTELLDGGDHALSDYPTRHLEPTLRWCGAAADATAISTD
jgi:predicted esterase YcpF (UPF0227 family)